LSVSSSNGLPCRLFGVLAVVRDLQDLDRTERGAETADGRELVGVDLCHVADDAGC
jgi:hypothetical protein